MSSQAIHSPSRRQHVVPAHACRPHDVAETPTAPPPRRRTGLVDYTIGRGARQVRVGPIAFWTIVGTLVIMGAWSIVTATYFAFQDDVLTRLIARQTEMQYAYEDRIAEMRAQVDRVTSRQLLDQEQFERKLDALLRRQTTLESRAGLIGSVADPTVTGSVKTPARPAANERAAQPKPSPINVHAPELMPLDRRAGREPRDLEGTVTRLQASLDRIETQQTNALNAMENSYESKLRRLRGVFSELGVDPGKQKSDGAMGGPFVPFRLASNPTAFERQVHRISLARAQAERLSRSLMTLPIRQPMDDMDTTSGFGMRIDPFVGRPALHSGQDFRGDVGDPIRATAAGEVVSAGWNGGYGKMVEIDHGNGLSTRYGHMSAIEVKVGQHVKVGQVVGRLGNTGRSTGPHLHYETRVDGDAVDPQKFLRVGARFGAGS
jgi:murein DD-endopeptidase MepM/ murein hydrolase activator NlpD